MLFSFFTKRLRLTTTPSAEEQEFRKTQREVLIGIFILTAVIYMVSSLYEPTPKHWQACENALCIGQSSPPY